MFTKEDTKAIKGVAIVLMLAHHLVSFADRYPVGFEGFAPAWYNLYGGKLMTDIMVNASICVTIFFFLGGYGLYKRWQAGSFSLLSNVIDLYKRYWKVFIIFVPIAYIFFSRTGDNINSLTKHYVISDTTGFLSSLLKNFTGLSSSINNEWWFLMAFLRTLPLGYLFCTIPRSNQKTRGFLMELFAVFMIDICVRNLFPSFANVPVLKSISDNFYFQRFISLDSRSICFFAGIACAKYDILVSLKRHFKRMPLRLPACIAGIIMISMLRIWNSYATRVDILFVPLLIALLSTALDCVRPVLKGFAFLGRHSDNMWLIHSFYCFYFLEVTQLVYCTQIIWIDLLILLALSLASSLLLEGLYKLLGKGWQRISRPTHLPAAS